jgi:drug/metabolite transporter (DMT)-like permease
MKNRTAILALIAAGSLWGITVALSKLSLDWLDPSWLTAMRFLVAAPLLAVIGRRGLRQAFTPRILLSGAVGYGAVVLLQSFGIDHTSVSHGAILVGALPVVVALVAASVGNGMARPLTWLGYGVALLGVVLVAGGGGGGATALGDILVFASVVLSGSVMAVQPGLLDGRDPAAVTAVQFFAAAVVSLPVALVGSGLPHVPSAPVPVVAFVALALAGTILPFWLFAYGQARVAPALAGAFVNLEPLVGVIVGWVAFSNPVGGWQVVGAFTVVVGILVSLAPPDRLVALPRVQRAIGSAQDGARALLAVRW